MSSAMANIANNYHLPLQCCYNCDYSYFNTYDDCLCKHLVSTLVIDKGGICDLYKYTNIDSASSMDSSVDVCIESEELAQEEKEKSCVNCKNSYVNTADEPMCNVTDSRIIKTSDNCVAWEAEY